MCVCSHRYIIYTYILYIHMYIIYIYNMYISKKTARGREGGVGRERHTEQE